MEKPDAAQMAKDKLIQDFKRMKIGVLERVDLLNLTEDDARAMTIAQLGAWARDHCPNAVAMMDKKRLKKDVIKELLSGCAARIKVEHAALERVRQRALDGGILPLELDAVDLYDGAPLGAASDLEMNGDDGRGDEGKDDIKSDVNGINGEPFEVMVDRILRERFGGLKQKAQNYDKLVQEFENVKMSLARDRATIKRLKDKLDEKEFNENKGDEGKKNENDNSGNGAGRSLVQIGGTRDRLRRQLGNILGRQPQALHVS